MGARPRRPRVQAGCAQKEEARVRQASIRTAVVSLSLPPGSARAAFPSVRRLGDRVDGAAAEMRPCVWACVEVGWRGDGSYRGERGSEEVPEEARTVERVVLFTPTLFFLFARLSLSLTQARPFRTAPSVPRDPLHTTLPSHAPRARRRGGKRTTQGTARSVARRRRRRRLPFVAWRPPVGPHTRRAPADDHSPWSSLSGE